MLIIAAPLAPGVANHLCVGMCIEPSFPLNGCPLLSDVQISPIFEVVRCWANFDFFFDFFCAFAWFATFSVPNGLVLAGES